MSNVAQRIKWIIVFLVFTVAVSVWYAATAKESEKMLTVAFLDVGQGDAIFIETPSGNQVLVDGGKDKTVLRALGSVMPFYDRSIDMVVATHPDKDHIGGLFEIGKRFSVAAFASSGVAFDDALYRSIIDIFKARGAYMVPLVRGRRIALGDGVYMEVLFPDRILPPGIDTNTSSVVLRITYGDTSFLLTGDAPRVIEEYVVKTFGGALRSDVLKLGHHGSRTSSSKVFLSAVSPRYAVISAGKGNRYGHPHKEVTDTLKAMNIPAFATYEKGTVVFESDGEEIFVK